MDCNHSPEREQLQDLKADEEEDESDEDDEDDVAAFQNWKMLKGAKNQNNYSSGQNRSGNSAGSGNNMNHNGKYCYCCKMQNHRQEEFWKRIHENKPSRDKQGRTNWPQVYVKMTIKAKVINTDSSRVFSHEPDTTLIQAPSNIPQLILSLCTISIAMCNKCFEIMTPFCGDKIRPRIAVKAGSKTFSWPSDTGAAVTCINKQFFDMAFGHSKPRTIAEPQSCVTASGDKMSSCGMFEVDLWIK